MSTTVSLKEFIIERLTAAAADIFSACEQTIVRYEEEIDRQRRLLEISLKPRINLTRIDIKQHKALATDTCFTVDPQDQMIHDQDEQKPPLNEEDRVNFNLKIEEEPEKSEPETESTSTSEKPDQSEAEGESGNLLSHSSDVEIQSKPAESGSYVQALKFNINGKNKMRKISQRQQEKETEKLRLFQSTCEERLIEEGEHSKDNHANADTNTDANTDASADASADANAGANADANADANKDTYKDTNNNAKSSWVCKICGKTLMCKNNLIIHMRIHTQERPYICSVCGMRFFQTSHLKRHKHTGLRAFTCDICGERFPHRKHLVKHMKTHQSENLFSCEMCGKHFYHQCSLRRHRLTHSKERPHVCNVYGKTYIQHSQLTRHKVTHTGQKLFTCDTCVKAYSYQCDLIRHNRINTRETPLDVKLNK